MLKNSICKLNFLSYLGLNIENITMGKIKKNILSVFLIFIFSLPVLIQGLHDTFVHDYSQDFNHLHKNTIKEIDNSICLIHDFKYYSFESNVDPLQEFLMPKKTYKASFYTSGSFNSIAHNFFLLRTPPSQY